MGNWGSNGANPKKERIVMLGLDNAGKTSILYKLKLGEDIQTTPTIGFNVETIKKNGIVLNVWDLGGQQKIRSLWAHHLKDAIGLIFVIDSNDQSRFDESIRELTQLLKDAQLAKAHVLVLLNKQDIPSATPAQEIIDLVKQRTNITERDHLFMACSAITGDGLEEAITWLAGKSTVRDYNAGLRCSIL
jgi:small GTP-binding protein